MTRRIILAAAAIVVSATLTPAFAGATLDRVTSTKTLTNVLVNDYPPFSFINDKNEVDGFDVDVAREVAKKLGVS
jgi:polar amino acid transport system substrate-binding protein